MKVGDYVRTKKGIAKIIDRINDPTNYYDKFWVCDRYLELNDDTEYIHEQDIIGEPKGRIIDLIEVGDYVNDEKIIDIGCLTNGSEKGTKVIDYYIAPNTVYYLKNEDIKSIVTKEQFENCMYKIGE